MRKYIFISLIIVLVVVLLKKLDTSEKRTTKLTQAEISLSVFGVGTIIAEEEFNLKFGVPSSVVAVYVKKGEKVTKGHPLLAIQGIGQVISPISGTITQVNFNIGENIPPQVTAVKVVNQDRTYVEVELEQENIAQVSNGQIAKIEFEAFRGKIIEGDVVAVFSDEKRFLVKIRLKEKIQGLLPGMTGDVAILTGASASGLKTTIDSLRPDGSLRIKKKDGQIIDLKPDAIKMVGEFAIIKDSRIDQDDEVLIGED